MEASVFSKYITIHVMRKMCILSICYKNKIYNSSGKSNKNKATSSPHEGDMPYELTVAKLPYL